VAYYFKPTEGKTMLIKFHKTGKVALNYGINGVIDVVADEVREMERGHALILIDNGIAVEAKAVINGAKVADSFMPDVEPEPSPEPKKRGRKPKAK
jgi:hypothetical protein